MNIHILKKTIKPRTSLRQCALAVAASAALGFAPSAAGEIVPVPPGLNPGDQYRLVFLTSTETYGRKSANGNSGFTTIQQYHDFAASTANAVPALNALSTTWKAIIATRNPTANAKTNTGTGTGTVPFYNLAGLRVADTDADLWDGSIQNPINVTELGTGPTLQYNNQYLVWTGMNDSAGADGGPSLIEPDGGYIRCGIATATDGTWASTFGTGDPNARQNDLQPIYAMSGILIAPDPNSPDCNMVSFTWNGYTGVIDEGATPNPTVTVRVPYGTSLNPLNPNPTYAISLNATCPKPNGGTGSLDFSSPQNYVVTAANGTNTKTYTASVIADIPAVTLSVSPSSISEDGGLATVTATLSNAISQDVTVNLSFSGTAVSGTNYTSSGVSITVLATETTGTVTLTGVQDNFYGLDKTALLDISTVNNGLEAPPQQVSVTITNTTTQPTGLPAPSGLNPTTGQPWQIGEQYQLVFVTSTIKANNHTTIDPYHTFVNTAAASSTLPGIPNIQWYAIGTARDDAATKPARVNALVSAPVYLVDGITLIATGYTDMWDGSLANGINKDQNGAVVAANTQVWTGTGQSSGLPYNYPTGPFYQTFNNDWSRFGLVGATNSAWITADQSSPGSKRMYALSGPLTNTVAPPTITVTLGMDQTTIAESAGAAIVTATLSQVAALDVTVNLAFTGTATLGTDYTAAPGTSIVITAGQLSGTATLTAVADGIYEGGNENIVVDIDSVLNALEDGTQQVTVTITEGDLQPAGLPMPLGINPATGILWQPGDSYQLVFVTSTITAATNPSITYYNTFVNTAATGSSVSGVPNIVWKAIGSALSDSATPAKVNAPVVAPVYLLDGVTKVANGYSDMWDGSIANPISLDESGVAVDAGVRAWTGSDAAGNSYRPLGKLDNYVQFGSTASTTGGWISSGEQQGGSNRMYALSVPLTHAGGVPAVAPLAPTITGITPGVGTLSVAFTAGYDGGAAITNYKYSTDDGATWTAVSPAATTSPILISGLTNGTTYQVRILAVNSVGDGAPSTAMSGTPDASGTSYATWATANGASTDPLEDSNNNGVPNGVEFFMGGTAASPAALPPLVNTAGTWSWTIPYDPAAQATYKFQVSGALTGWTDVLPGDPSIAVLTGPDQLRLTLPTGMRFCRLVVTPN